MTLRVHINTGDSLFNNAAGKPILIPAPKINGVGPTFCYCFGNAYAQKSRIFGATAYGPGLDWTGNGYNILDFGESASLIGDFGLTGSVQGAGVTKLPAALHYNMMKAATGACSFVILAKSPATARTIALLRPGTATPNMNLTLAPQSAQLRAAMTDAVPVVNTATTPTLTTEIADNISLFGGTYSETFRQAFAKHGNNATKVGTNSVTTVVSNTSPFEIMDEASTGTGVTVAYVLAGYPLQLSQANFEYIKQSMVTFHSAWNNGLVVT